MKPRFTIGDEKSVGNLYIGYVTDTQQVDPHWCYEPA